MKKWIIVCSVVFIVAVILLIVICTCTGCKQHDHNSVFDPKGEYLAMAATSLENGEAYLLINQFFVPRKNVEAVLMVNKKDHGFDAKCISTFGTTYTENELAHIVRVYRIDFNNQNRVTINKQHFIGFPEKYSDYLPIDIESRKIKND